MKGKVVAVCGIVAVLGIISAAVGFVAEATKVKASDVYIDIYFECVYPSSPALGLGIFAAICAIINRIIIFILVGFCCRPRGSISSQFSSLFNILSWVASIIAVILLMVAAVLNNRQGGEKDSYGIVVCYVPKPGVFAVGGVLSLLSAIFGIVAYISISSAREMASKLELEAPVANSVDIASTPPVANNVDIASAPPVAMNVDLERRQPNPQQ